MTNPLETIDLLSSPLVQDSLDVMVMTAGSKSPVDLDITFVGSLVIFLASWGLLKFLLFDPYLKVREEREAGIGGSKDEAEALQKDAEEKLATYEAKMEEARAKASEARNALRSEGTAEERSILDAAHKASTAHLSKERAQIETQIAEARTQLEKEAQSLSKLMADQLLPSA